MCWPWVLLHMHVPGIYEVNISLAQLKSTDSPHIKQHLSNFCNSL